MATRKERDMSMETMEKQTCRWKPVFRHCPCVLPTTCPLDPIPSPLLRSISLDLLPFISSLINSSLSSGCVPQAFKTARVVPILKKPLLDSSDVSSYRPVSLLPFLSKILERAVYNQLSFFLSQNQLQDINQSGFKPAHSTETALIAVTERLQTARSAKLSSVLILLDLSAAFDTVNHKILLSVLTDLGITGTAWKWFESYLEDRHYQVTWNGSTSAPCRLSTGVPQGSVLGPLLFSLYTLSLGEVITSHGFSYHCYADDTQLMLSFPSSDTQVCNRISACLTDISSWMTAHHLKLNPSKTELLFIPSTTGPHCDLTISFGNSLITPTEDARSLGVILDGQLSFSAHIANLTRSCRFLLYNIRRIRPFLSQEATQLLVQSLVISRLDYCNSLLAGLPLRAIRPLQLVQNAAARLIFNLPKFTHVTPLLRSLHWLPVVARIRFKTLLLICQEWTSASLPYGNGEESSCTSSPSCFKYSSSRTTTPEDSWKTSVQTLLPDGMSAGLGLPGRQLSEPKPVLDQGTILAPIRWEIDDDIDQANTSEPIPESCPPDRLYVAPQFLDRFITQSHTSLILGHPGEIRTLYWFSGKYWWDSMSSDIY
ncbi:hypothetical protein NFI96_030749 [Prochilodus magdalenae]|nr:hypothetical protein NFI96_030749 [Prochilodus magdalenae]